MRNLFNVNSPFWVFISKIADLMILNGLFLISCLPVITIGTSITTLSSITLRIVKKEEVNIVREYVSTFKINFKQSTSVGAIMLAIGTVLLIDLYIIKYLPTSLNKLMYVLIFIIIILYSLVLFYVFPYVSRFEVKTKIAFKNSFIISVLNLPYTLVIIGFTIFVGSIVFWTPFTFVWGINVWILIGFSATALVNSYILNKVFIKYEDIRCV